MNRYYVRIDGRESPKAYSYAELKELGVFEFDDIQVRKMLDNQWHSIRSYNFPEATSTSDYSVDEFGQIIRPNNSSTSDYTIDAYGQIVRPGNTGTSTSTDASGTSTSSNEDPGCGIIFLKLLLTAGTIGLCVALGVGSIGIATPVLVYGGWKALESIWSDWD